MAFKLTGTDLPVASLFAWLRGQAEEAPGWQVDLKELPAGRLQARHIEEVQAELKIILER
jgi:outer membrane lipoprotein LolB